MLNKNIAIAIIITVLVVGGVSYAIGAYIINGLKTDSAEATKGIEQLTLQVQNLQESIVQQPPREGAVKEVPTLEAPLYFEYGRHAVGDRIGGMTISAITPITSGQPVASDNLEVAFAGAITLSGRFECPGEGIGSAYDFYPDENNVLPRLKGSDYDEGQWFGFMTEDKSPLLIKPADLVCEKKATITIDKFIIQNYPSEVQDWAHLVTGKTN